MKDIPLPHRWPMLFVDDYELTENGIVGYYTVDEKLPIFKGHFPGNPIMPGVLLVEMIAQVGGVLVYHLMNKQFVNPITLLTDIKDARFKEIVRPGDKLKIIAAAKPLKAGLYLIDGKVMKDGKLAAKATVRVLVREGT